MILADPTALDKGSVFMVILLCFRGRFLRAVRTGQPTELLAEGQAVEFEVRKGPKGLQAENVVGH
jgi:hypothetical protein